jgi:hypothetical protein
MIREPRSFIVRDLVLSAIRFDRASRDAARSLQVTSGSFGPIQVTPLRSVSKLSRQRVGGLLLGLFLQQSGGNSHLARLIPTRLSLLGSLP